MEVTSLSASLKYVNNYHISCYGVYIYIYIYLQMFLVNKS